MIIYQASKSKFLDDSFTRDIEEVVREAFLEKHKRKVAMPEFRAWKESLLCMARVLHDDDIPLDAGVAVEYNIPGSGKRVDFILTGHAEDRSSSVIVVELKQWSKAFRTDRDAIVKTALGGGLQEVSHPSYQAWSYALLLQGFNEAVEDHNLDLKPCAYLHNYRADGQIDHEFYSPYMEKAPLFLGGERERQRLRAFIKQHVKFGDKSDLIYKIENGRIRPSKALVDSLVGMLKGNQEFILIDDQKVTYEHALAAAHKARNQAKQVVIVEGGPGTGKSVVAVNLLVALSKLGLNSRYVSKNAAPRAVYESRLTGERRKTAMSNLFMSSGSFMKSEENDFDVLIVDEAHRLNEKSGFYGNQGENQIKELIHAAKCTILFVDDSQRVTVKDIGSKAEIARWAESMGCAVSFQKLESQFRCNGSDAYLSWLDNTLGVRRTVNEVLDTSEFDFQVIDSPSRLHELIEERNGNNKARVVAGYCWRWASKADSSRFDIVIPEHGYERRWNLTSDGSLWIIARNSVEEVGCIHTCQGLEVDYIGVIVGPDFIVRNEQIVCQPDKRDRFDSTLKGYKDLLKSDPVAGQERIDSLIKNTYRTLMTRGMKGCYIFCTDAETAAYFRRRCGASDDR